MMVLLCREEENDPQVSGLKHWCCWAMGGTWVGNISRPILDVSEDL